MARNPTWAQGVGSSMPAIPAIECNVAIAGQKPKNPIIEIARDNPS